ncbi:MAG: putative quinol monooxygenase [Acidimicrobiales bacterium]
MPTLTGYLDLKPEEREQTVAALRAVSERSRRDDGYVQYWWAEDVETPCRFRSFECWASEEAFLPHQDQPYEHTFMADPSRITGADARELAVADRRSTPEG